MFHVITFDYFKGESYIYTYNFDNLIIEIKLHLNELLLNTSTIYNYDINHSNNDEIKDNLTCSVNKQIQSIHDLKDICTNISFDDFFEKFNFEQYYMLSKEIMNTGQTGSRWDKIIYGGKLL